MQNIFISYRRDDTEGQAGRLFEALRSEFGAEHVFMDVATIEPGVDFRRAIERNTADCGVLLALIGRGWLTLTDEQGRRRIDDPDDFVRLETAAALKRDIPVVPVLVHGAQMPRADQLPADLHDLAYRNAVELSHARWDSDVQLLITALRRVLERTPGGEPSPRRRWLPLGAVGALAAATLAGIHFWPAAKPSVVPPVVLSASTPLTLPATGAGPASAPASTPTPAPAPAPTQPTAHGSGICVNGYVWREARPGDIVCVTPKRRSITVNENQQADSRRRPKGGASGPDTCVVGFVWREAFDGDHVCVKPASREAAAEDNREGPSRVVP
ncbi:toll/interleukin-1 receptor domain-containing protein [Paucibacter sp. R3-3]|uniref:Toll/interleukin-1 receptor domain-containing protein n=1 Tax=Roseateles agri TaxID=3098619 RepID=A0ABU5DDL0_9BURK|nr:toll/interleukin-1 receptor domain-containing protein [Paucibacter sp. R3-3]MDY0743896.1 toll/interleukin-1 receptor domain-containing protein [Paucibacter sp. R3-3]